MVFGAMFTSATPRTPSTSPLSACQIWCGSDLRQWPCFVQQGESVATPVSLWAADVLVVNGPFRASLRDCTSHGYPMTNRITKKFAAGCVAEWSGTIGYPLTREGLARLIETFQKVAESEAHARQIVEDLQADSIYCPRPAEIRRVAIAIQSPSADTKIKGCWKCDHTGFREALPVNGYAMVRRCECGGTASP